MNSTFKIAILAAAVHAETSAVSGINKILDFFKEELTAAREAYADLKSKFDDDETQLAADKDADLDGLIAELGTNTSLLTASTVANTQSSTEASPEDASKAAQNAASTADAAAPVTGSVAGEQAGSASGKIAGETAGTSAGSVSGTPTTAALAGTTGDASSGSAAGSGSQVTPFDTTEVEGGNPDAVIQPGESPNQNTRTTVGGDTSNVEQVGSSAATQAGGSIDNTGVSPQGATQIDPAVSPIPSSAVSSDGSEPGKVNGTNVAENAQPGTSTLEPPAPGGGPVDGLQPENNQAVTPGQAGIDANTKPSQL